MAADGFRLLCKLRNLRENVMAFSSLSIGTSALLTARYGLDVTGQNLGNVNTPGYSRQKLNQVATQGRSFGAGLIFGNGVRGKSVTNIVDEFAEKQLRQATTQDEYYGALNSGYSNLQAFFNENTGNALSDAMSGFWNSMQDFSANVESIPVRTTTIEQARQVAGRFSSLGTQLAQERKNLDEKVAESVTEINRLLNGIAELNKGIVHGEYGGSSESTAGDLRDKRGELVKELYQYMDVDIVEEDNGSYIVSMHGRSMVYFDQVKGLENKKTLSPDGTMVNTPVFASDKYPIRPRDGKLAAQIELRDEILPSYQKELDNLAANFIWEFNRAHSQLTGLDAYKEITALNAPKNPQDTLDKMNWAAHEPEGVFQIVNGNFEIVIHNKHSNEPTTVNIEVDLDGRPGPGGEPDMILWDPENPEASNSLVNRMQTALDNAAPGAFKVDIDRNNRLSVTALQDDFDFTFGKDTSGVLAALGLNVLFTGHTAASMGVNEEIAENPALLGGEASFLDGDNNGANFILDVRSKKIDALGGVTLDDSYMMITGRLGSEAQKAINLKDLSCDVLNRMYTQREAISGVNEDEEVTKLITYQRSFQSAAKFISTVDQLYETLINM